MILTNLIKPKWQHSNPSIRKLEVGNLDDQAILNKVAENDKAVEVRQAAIKKINDFTVLNQIAQFDIDRSVRELAEQRLKQLLCCQKGDCPDLETRLTWIKNTIDAERLAYVAVNGPEVELRKAAIEKIEREGVLGDIAINDSNGEVRLAAVNKLTQKSTLERVVKVARNSDKRVSRKAREKLDEIERPAKVRAECEEISASLESLGHRLSSEFSSQRPTQTAITLKSENTELRKLLDRWQAIAADANTECQIRFDKAQQVVTAALENYQQAQIAAQKLEQARAPLRAAKQALCEKMEALLLLVDLKKHQRISEEYDEVFNTLQSEWTETQALDDSDEERNWQARFERALKSVEKRHQKLQADHEIANQLEIVCCQAEALLKNADTIKAEQLKNLQARREKVSQPEQPLSIFSELNNRFDNTMKGLQLRWQKQKQQRSKVVDELKKVLNDLEAALEAGELKIATPLEQKARDLLKSLDNLSTASQPKEMERRLQSYSAKINELRGWQRWGNKLEREKLCEQVEGLLEAENDTPAEIVRKIEKAQAAWKRLGASGYSRQLWERFNKVRQTACQRYREHLCQQMEELPEYAKDNPESAAKMILQAQDTWKDVGSQGHSQKLWERFNKACKAAYEPCRTHFKLKANERQQHFQEKQAVCELLEAFFEGSDWEHVDWKEVYRLVRDTDKKWKNIGPTDRKLKKGVQQRFQAIMEVLETLLDEERQRNCHARLFVMGEVEQVANNLQEFIDAQKEAVDDRKSRKLIEINMNDAIEKVKQLQEQWQVTVPGSRSVEREFWKTFRSGCDVVFNLRKQQQEEHKKEIQSYLKSKIALCEQVEALANSETDAIKDYLGQVKKLKEDWKNIKADWNKIDTYARRRKAKVTEAVADRFDKACQQIERQYQAQLAYERREQLDLLKQKAAFCVELEQADTLAKLQDQEGADWLSSVQATWAELPKLEDADLETAMEQRFQQACTVALTSEQKVSKDALKNKDTLCVRMEILAGIESPSEAAKSRLAYQVARLSAAMRSGERESRDPEAEAKEIEQSWYLSGTAPSEETARLEQRFSKACEAFYSRRL